MDDLDKALDALKIQIKKEIIDNYFAERCQLEEDHQALEEQVAAYRQEQCASCRPVLVFLCGPGAGGRH